jgi:hypothetical protein
MTETAAQDATPTESYSNFGLCRGWVGFDLVTEDEVGAGIAGAGGGELVAERG